MVNATHFGGAIKVDADICLQCLRDFPEGASFGFVM